jgi:hypothetical protein
VEIKKRRYTMDVMIIVTLAVLIPVILLPTALVWYINIGGIVQAVREARATREKKVAAKTLN